MGFRKTAIFTYGLVLLLSIGWIAGAVLAPLMESAGTGNAGTPNSSGGLSHWWIASLILRGVYHFVCHQIPARCIWLDGRPMAVCARCFGIYFGYLFGLILYPFSGRFAVVDNPPRKWLILALVPVCIDFLGGYIGLFHNTATSRVITGSIAGGAGVFYTMPGLISVAATLLAKARVLGRPTDRQLCSGGYVTMSGGPGGEEFSG